MRILRIGGNCKAMILRVDSEAGCKLGVEFTFMEELRALWEVAVMNSQC